MSSAFRVQSDCGTGWTCPECRRPVPPGSMTYDCRACTTDGLCERCAFAADSTCETYCVHCGRWLGTDTHGGAPECQRCASGLDGEG